MSFVLLFSFGILEPSVTNELKAAGARSDCNIVLKYRIGSLTYYVDDIQKQMDTAPKIKNGRTFLVIGFVLNNIPGASLDWEGIERKITVKTPNGRIIKLWIDNPRAEVDGIKVDIDPEKPGLAAPYIEDNRTKVPMRFVANLLNANVEWIAATNTVILTILDTINCYCAWTNKGKIKLDSDLHKDLLLFDSNCDGTFDQSYTYVTNTFNINPSEGYFGPIDKYEGCATLCISKNNRVIRWNALPNDPDCCPKPKNARIKATFDKICQNCVSENFNLIVTNLQTQETRSFNQIIWDSVLQKLVCDTGNEPSVLDCPGTYLVTPINTNESCVFFPKSRTIEFTSDNSLQNGCDHIEIAEFTCQEKPIYARFIAKFGNDFKEYIESITVAITKKEDGSIIMSGKPVWIEEENRWIYDSGPLLPCPGNYTITPLSSSGCEFTVPSWTIKFSKELGNCCDKNAFEVYQFYRKVPVPEPEKKGRIYGKVYGGIFPNATIIVYNESGQKLFETKTDETGYFESSPADVCLLPCPGKYLVVPSKEGCTFTPSSMEVVLNDKNCCEEKYESYIEFTANCPTKKCCDWNFQTIPGENIEKLLICPGDTRIIEYYEIVNNCSIGGRALNFSIIWPLDGNIIAIDPKTFVLEPQERKTLIIAIEMPYNNPLATPFEFPFTINCKECGKKEVKIIAYTKDCWCKDTSKIIKITTLNLDSGWIEGTKKDSKDITRFYFDYRDSKWRVLKINQCVEICYTTKKDEEGKILDWAYNYRIVDCAQPTKHIKYKDFKPEFI
jgi:hypothetical protein